MSNICIGDLLSEFIATRRQNETLAKSRFGYIKEYMAENVQLDEDMSTTSCLTFRIMPLDVELGKQTEKGTYLSVKGKEYIYNQFFSSFVVMVIATFDGPKVFTGKSGISNYEELENYFINLIKMKISIFQDEEYQETYYVDHATQTGMYDYD